MLRSIAVCTIAVLLPSLALADDDSRSFAERAKVYAFDDQVRLYGLPTKDTEGNLKYFDVVMTIKIGPNGKPKRATLSPVPSSTANATTFFPGTYAGAGVTCVLGVTDQSGQQRLDLLCDDDADPTKNPSVTWYAGAFNDNPFLPTLLDRSIDLVPGHEDMAWGLIGNAEGFSDFTDCLEGTASTGVTAAAQVGANLVLTYFRSDSQANCSVALLRLEN